MSYRHLTDDELENRVEVYGTENEREILHRFLHTDWENCPHCMDAQDRADSAEDELNSLIRQLFHIMDDCDLSDAEQLKVIRKELE